MGMPFAHLRRAVSYQLGPLPGLDLRPAGEQWVGVEMMLHKISVSHPGHTHVTSGQQLTLWKFYGSQSLSCHHDWVSTWT